MRCHQILILRNSSHHFNHHQLYQWKPRRREKVK